MQEMLCRADYLLLSDAPNRRKHVWVTGFLLHKG